MKIMTQEPAPPQAETAFELQPPNPLLANVDPQVINLLGEAAVIRIEEGSAALQTFEDLRNKPNPFSLGGPSSCNLSGVPEKYRNDLMNGVRPRAVLSHPAETKAWDTLFFTTKKVRRDIKDARKQTSEIATAFDALNLGSEHTRLQLAAATAFADSLDGLGSKLASRATLIALKNINKAMKRDLEAAARRTRRSSIIPSVIVKKTRNYLIRDYEKREKELEQAAADNGEVARWGSQVYCEFIGSVRREEGHLALEMLESIADAAVHIPKTTEDLAPQDLDAAITAERYLVGRVLETEAIVRKVDSGLIERPEVKGKIKSLGYSALQNHVDGMRRNTEAKTADGFVARLSEARSILRGGKGLENGNGKNRGETMTDKLYALRDKGRVRVFQPEDCGIVIAVLTGKFDSFCETMAAVRTTNTDDPAVKHAHNTHGEVVRALQHFEKHLPEALRRIVEAMDPLSPVSKDICKAIGYSEVAKVHKELKARLEPQAVTDAA